MLKPIRDRREIGMYCADSFKSLVGQHLLLTSVHVSAVVCVPARCEHTDETRPDGWLRDAKGAAHHAALVLGGAIRPPRMRLDNANAAGAPFVIPHLLKPVAMTMLSLPGEIGPT
jgi:hypothetical protein